MTAVLATTLVGFGGLAAETAFWYAQKRALQTQADAAALSGAYELLQGQTATTAQTWATHDAVLNGFSNRLWFNRAIIVIPRDQRSWRQSSEGCP